MERFIEFAQLVESHAVESMKEDIIYGTIPDEFKGISNSQSDISNGASLSITSLLRSTYGHVNE